MATKPTFTRSGKFLRVIIFDKTDNLKFKNYYVEYPNVFNWVGDGLITVTTFFKKSEMLPSPYTEHTV